MCGFVGYINKKEKKQDIIEKMSKRIEHRGPDAEGFYKDEDIELAHRRLSIIDLASGNQPIYNETKDLVIVFNGEIYNFPSLREDLEAKGHKFVTNTDTEVIVHGYEEYQEGILNKLRGMFAFVIWDKKNKELFGARDIFGIKPFYYTIMNDTFMFGSEIKAFLEHPDFTKELNLEALKMYLSFQYNPLNETFFKGVYKLEPRHYLKYRDGKLEIKEYYNFEFKEEKIKEKDLIQKIEEQVEESVEAHKISDVKVGAYLSSGIDSSYIVSILKPNETFTVGFENKGFDETEAAQTLSKMLNIENKRQIIDDKDFFQVLSKVQYYSDEPHANLSTVPLYFLSALAKKDVTVVLSGEGADELFAGYQTYQESKLIKAYRHLPKFLRTFNAKIANKLPNFKGKNFLIKGSKSVEELYMGQAHIFTDKETKELINPEYLTDITIQDVTKPYFEQAKGLDDVTKMQYLDMFLWLPNDILLKADKMTMANSLELRVPYLDKEVFKLALALPKKYKLRKGLSKYALRKAAENKIPQEWFKRPKLGFLVPFKEYLKKKEYYELIKEEFESDIAKKFFNEDMLIDMLDKHYQGKEETHRKIYTIYAFLLWYKQFFL